MPAKLKVFFTGFGLGLLDLMINLSEFFGVGTNPESPYVWTRYDIKTTNLFSNLNTVILLLCIGIALIPVFVTGYMISSAVKCEKLEDFFKRRLSEYRWNFFLRFWIESYIEIVAACYLASNMFSNSVEAVVSYCILLLSVLSIIGVLCLLIRNQQKITEDSPQTKRFSSLFDEFRTDSDSRYYIFYTLFFFRRFSYISMIYFLSSYPLIQVISNSFLSFIAFSYIVKYKPFQFKRKNYISAYSEFILFIIFAVEGLFLLELSDSIRETISRSIMILSGLIFAGTLVVLLLAIISRKTATVAHDSNSEQESDINQNALDNGSLFARSYCRSPIQPRNQLFFKDN